MKHLLFLFLFIGLTFISASPQQDTITVSVKSKDNHVISMGFKEFRRYMDSSNHYHAVDRYALAQEQRLRDSITHAGVGVLITNEQLRIKNDKLDKENEFYNMMPHYAMVFLLIFAATFFSLGFVNYLTIRLRKNAN